MYANKKKVEWVRCPICKNKTRDRIREDIVLKNYPLYCPKCKRQTLIETRNLQITVITEPDA
ncbi:conjugal transfer protein [Clostridiales bacterium]|nr:conjugal transfer protein [Clostridiales bacterium]